MKFLFQGYVKISTVLILYYVTHLKRCIVSHLARPTSHIPHAVSRILRLILHFPHLIPQKLHIKPHDLYPIYYSHTECSVPNTIHILYILYPTSNIHYAISIILSSRLHPTFHISYTSYKHILYPPTSIPNPYLSPYLFLVPYLRLPLSYSIYRIRYFKKYLLSLLLQHTHIYIYISHI